MVSDMLAVTYGLASALSWGIGDFSGGLATRRSAVFGVVFASQCIGAVLLLGLCLGFDIALPTTGRLFLGALAGLGGSFGLLCLYAGLAGGRMGVVAPLSAVLAVIPPVALAVLRLGLPPLGTLAGFGAAVLAIWLLTSSGREVSASGRDMLFSLGAGAGFGLFFICIDAAGREGFLWSLLAARAATMLLFAAIALVRGKLALPVAGQWRVVALCGLFDTLGNAFFALAAAQGRLDTAVVLSSFYPAITAVMAFLFLGERLSGRQWCGVLLAVVALPFIA